MNPYKKGDKVILKVDIQDEYGQPWYRKGQIMTVDRTWTNHDGARGRWRTGVTFEGTNGFGARIENIEPTLQTQREHTLSNLLG